MTEGGKKKTQVWGCLQRSWFYPFSVSTLEQNEGLKTLGVFLCSWLNTWLYSESSMPQKKKRNRKKGREKERERKTRLLLCSGVWRWENIQLVPLANNDIFFLADNSVTYQMEITYSYALQIENGAFLGENRETPNHEKYWRPVGLRDSGRK